MRVSDQAVERPYRSPRILIAHGSQPILRRLPDYGALHLIRPAAPVSFTGNKKSPCVRGLVLVPER